LLPEEFSWFKLTLAAGGSLASALPDQGSFKSGHLAVGKKKEGKQRERYERKGKTGI